MYRYTCYSNYSTPGINFCVSKDREKLTLFSIVCGKASGIICSWIFLEFRTNDESNDLYCTLGEKKGITLFHPLALIFYVQLGALQPDYTQTSCTVNYAKICRWCDAIFAKSFSISFSSYLSCTCIWNKCDFPLPSKRNSFKEFFKHCIIFPKLKTMVS